MLADIDPCIERLNQLVISPKERVLVNRVVTLIDGGVEGLGLNDDALMNWRNDDISALSFRLSVGSLRPTIVSVGCRFLPSSRRRSMIHLEP